MIIHDMQSEIQIALATALSKLREYSQAQKGMWQMIPWLALQADGRHGRSRNYTYTYRTGCWPIVGLPRVAIDCATGEFVDTFHGNKEIKETGRLLLCLQRLDDFNAQKIVRQLTEEAKYGYFLYDAQKTEAWRAELIKTIGLTERFVRDETRKIPFFELMPDFSIEQEDVSGHLNTSFD